MRSLNMNDLPWLRRTTLAGKRCIGKGEFASVYGSKEGNFDTVIKITTDQLSYYLQSDQLWLDVRNKVEHHFPKLIEDFGDIGESRGVPAYMLELECLRPISTTAHRKLIRGWVKSREEMRSGLPSGSCLTRADIAFVDGLAEANGPYAKVFEALSFFLSNYGGLLDLKIANFMERPSTGELVFNDVVFDQKAYFKRSKQRFH